RLAAQRRQRAGAGSAGAGRCCRRQEGARGRPHHPDLLRAGAARSIGQPEDRKNAGGASAAPATARRNAARRRVYKPDRRAQRSREVGVGTGLSLPYFRPDSQVTGIDISAEMLEKARRRVGKQQLKHVDALHVMDAEHLDFEDNSFDAVLALYVASVVPSPARFAAEMRRVCIPGGTIVLVNHFTSENWAARFMEKRLAHLARHIGFHADFP